MEILAMARPVRVGAVNYLNTKPIIEGLENLAPHFRLSLDLPARLADQLANNELDVALIPVIEFFRGQTYGLIPGVAIGSRGPVLSVTLFSKVPWPQIRSVTLDEGSRTSAALTELMLRQRYQIEAQFEPLPIDRSFEGLKTDAVLLIGDRAMRACLPGYEYAYDLGEEWTDWTGLPFVFAVWAVREDLDPEELAPYFQAAKQLGLQRIGPIAAREAPGLDLDPGFCRRYLTNIVRYDLGQRELAGLSLFYERASALGLAPMGVNLERYLNRSDLVASC
jgi:chorismate dehydratase